MALDPPLRPGCSSARCVTCTSHTQPLPPVQVHRQQGTPHHRNRKREGPRMLLHLQSGPRTALRELTSAHLPVPDRTPDLPHLPDRVRSNLSNRLEILRRTSLFFFFFFFSSITFFIYLIFFSFNRCFFICDAIIYWFPKIP